MILPYGLLALGLYAIGIGLLRHSLAGALVGLGLLLLSASSFQARRVAKRWRDEAEQRRSVR
jgi:hypothetical protein